MSKYEADLDLFLGELFLAWIKVCCEPEVYKLGNIIDDIPGANIFKIIEGKNESNGIDRIDVKVAKSFADSDWRKKSREHRPPLSFSLEASASLPFSIYPPRTNLLQDQRSLYCALTFHSSINHVPTVLFRCEYRQLTLRRGVGIQITHRDLFAGLRTYFHLFSSQHLAFNKG